MSGIEHWSIDVVSNIFFMEKVSKKCASKASLTSFLNVGNNPKTAITCK